MSATAKPSRITIKNAGHDPVPNLDLERGERRRASDPAKVGRVARALGASLAGIKAARLRPRPKEWQECRVEEAGRRQLEDARPVVRPRRGPGDRRRRAGRYPQVDVALCVPAILIERAARAVPGFAIGGQDVHHAEKGAHTGCISARDAARCRREPDHRRPFRAARRAARRATTRSRRRRRRRCPCGLDVILCVGESLDVREAGRAVDDGR